MADFGWRCGVLLLAVALDVMFGEPPNRFHPVAWMGSVIGALGQLCRSTQPTLRFVWGVGIVVAGVGALGVVGWGIEHLKTWAAPHAFPMLLVLILHAVVLKSCVGIRSLSSAASSVVESLRGHDLQTARERLGFHLVSRDVATLSPSQASAASIESVAENTSDSVVAPLFFYMIAGIPGALIYRFANTCDAMLGYRTPELIWLG
ncbi:MAG: adenosylcobinamide-phosphate synthase CbiB, partial [Planctomycetota bacterium]